MRQRWMVKVLVGTVMLSGAWGNTTLSAEEDEHRREMHEGMREGQGGVITGILLERDRDGKWIRVKPDGEQESRKFIPRWIGGAPKDGGGLDEKMCGEIKKVYSFNRVRLAWVFEEHPRVIGIELLKPKAERGTFSGEVTARDGNFIEVTNADGVSQRFVPHWRGGMPKDGGGLDKEVLEKIRQYEVGDHVDVAWEYEERPRVVDIRSHGDDAPR